MNDDMPDTAGAATPETPRLVRGLALIPVDDALLVDGGPRRHRLGGAAARSVLPRLLPLLDGRPLERINAETGLSPAQLGQVLEILRDRDLVETGRAATYGTAGEEVLDYFSRNISALGGHRSAEEITDVLAESAVVISAPARLAESIAADLTETGVQTVLIASGESFESDVKAVEAATHRHAIVCHSPDDPAGDETFAAYAETWQRRDVPVLRFARRTGQVEVGPSLYPGYTACARCVVRDHATFRGQDRDEAHDSAPPDPRAVDAVLAGLVTAATLAGLTATTPPVAPREMIRIELPEYRTDRFHAVPNRDCVTCGLGGQIDETAAHVEAYEWLQRDLPDPLRIAEDTSSLRQHMIRSLLTSRKEHPYAPRRPLPGNGEIPPLETAYGDEPGDGTGRLDLPVLAGILLRVGGRRSNGTRGTAPDRQTLSRWTPTGGNQASVEIYGVADSGLLLLPATVFSYDDIGHQLVGLRSDRPGLDHALATTDLDPGAFDLALVLVGAVRRLSRKYGDFAYRLAHLDAGCAALQLATVARGYGLRIAFASSWDEHFGEIFDLDPGKQIVTAVAGVRGDRRTQCR